MLGDIVAVMFAWAFSKDKALRGFVDDQLYQPQLVLHGRVVTKATPRDKSHPGRAGPAQYTVVPSYTHQAAPDFVQ